MMCRAEKNRELRADAEQIVLEAIDYVMPDEAVKKALVQLPQYNGELVLVAIGKASWQMAKAASGELGNAIDKGIVITKYNHNKGPLENIVIHEAGHPISDKNSYMATQEAIDIVEALSEDDLVLLLISGGGSALFEKPLIDCEELECINRQLLASGADIKEINTIRKRLSAVKAGRFAQICSPAQVFAVILSDIIGDSIDMIASGPAYPDNSTSEDALKIIDKYGIEVSDKALEQIKRETPKNLNNVTTVVTGSVSELCKGAKLACEKLGYETEILNTELTCQARDAGTKLAALASEYQSSDKSLAFILGGETVVKVTGKGKGGRNQEIALSAAEGIHGFGDTAIFSIGSDGTDGPTDAAGGYVDGHTYDKLVERGMDVNGALRNNDSYHALSAVGGLIITGPTGTNVNDVSVLLIKR